MSSESVRNLLNNTVTRVITTSKQQIKEQGKKQVLKLKQQIPSPADLINELKADVSETNCTGKGKEKFDNKHQKIIDKIDKLQNAVGKALDKLSAVEEKLKKITDPSGVLAKINQLASVLQPITAVLGTTIIIAKILIKVAGHIPLPPNGAGVPPGPIILAKDLADIAGGKIAEYSALVLSLTIIVQLYTNKINKILNIITTAVTKLKALKDQLDKLVLLAQFAKMNHESKCDDLLNDSTGATGTGTGTGTGDGSGSGSGDGDGLGVNTIDGNNIHSLNDGLSLEDLTSLIEDKYANTLANLRAQGDTRALERISVLQKETKEWVLKYNISFKIVNI